MSRRSYRQYCALARALDVIGERWTLLVVRELARGPQRYSDVLAALPGVGTSLLAERLKHLEREGIVARSYLPPPAASTVYELTDDGRDLAKALTPLLRWGAKRLGRASRRDTVRIEWLLQFMAATCDESRSIGVHETYEIRLRQGVFHVEAKDGALAFREGPATQPDLVVETDVDTFTGLGTGAVDAAEATSAGRLRVEGSPDAALRALWILSPA